MTLALKKHYIIDDDDDEDTENSGANLGIANDSNGNGNGNSIMQSDSKDDESVPDASTWRLSYKYSCFKYWKTTALCNRMLSSSREYFILNFEKKTYVAIDNIKYLPETLEEVMPNTYRIYADVLFKNGDVDKNSLIHFTSICFTELLILKKTTYSFAITLDNPNLKRTVLKKTKTIILDWLSLCTSDKLYIPRQLGYWNSLGKYGCYGLNTDAFANVISWKRISDKEWSTIDYDTADDLLVPIQNIEELIHQPVQIERGDLRMLIIRTSLMQLGYGIRPVFEGDIGTTCKCRTHSIIAELASSCTWLKRHTVQFAYSKNGQTINFSRNYIDQTERKCICGETVDIVLDQDKCLSTISETKTDDTLATVAIVYANQHSKPMCVALPCSDNVSFIQNLRKFKTNYKQSDDVSYRKQIFVPTGDDTTFGTTIQFKGNLANHIVSNDERHCMNLSVPEMYLPDNLVEISTKCCICFENEREFAFIPCGHRSICRGCKSNFHNNSKCPVCRTQSSSIIPIFL